MTEPIAWMVVNNDGTDAYVTSDPALAKTGQRALPLYTAPPYPVMQECNEIRSSSPTSGGGFSTAWRNCTCHPDDNPPVPCPQKFALTECRNAAAKLEQVKRIIELLLAREKHDCDEAAALLREGWNL